MMKTLSVKTILIATVALITVSCKKENSVTDDVTASSVTQATVADMGAIAVSTAGSGSKDSLYVIGACDRICAGIV